MKEILAVQYPHERAYKHSQPVSKRFEMANGRLPTQSEGLAAIVKKPNSPDLPNWMQLLKEMPLDPWGHPFQYVVPAPNGDLPYRLYSLGPDGISRTNGDDPDDVGNWAKKSD